MALGEDTQKMLAVKFPNSWHLIEDIETVCTTIKTQNGGKGEVKFTATGLDRCNRLVVKMIETGLRIFRGKRDDEDEACKRVG